MRVVVCDGDPLLASMIESVLEARRHDIVGVADNTAIGTQLVTAARPDLVIVDLSLGYNTDFDIIEAAMTVGARVVVFSHNADHAVLDRYEPRPIVVAKPDLQALERAIEREATTSDEPVASKADRRRRPARAAVGAVPTGVSDAQAFYEALGNAVEGDALLAIDADDDAELIATLVRSSDRVVDTGAKILVFLAAGGDVGVAAFTRRLSDGGSSAMVRSVVIGADEIGADAFARLKSTAV